MAAFQRRWNAAIPEPDARTRIERLNALVEVRDEELDQNVDEELNLSSDNEEPEIDADSGAIWKRVKEGKYKFLSWLCIILNNIF